MPTGRAVMKLPEMTRMVAPAIGVLFGAIGAHLAGSPDIKMLEPVPAGDPAKGQLRA
jgi:hypothetical protein